MTIDNTPNKVAYELAPRRFLDLLQALLFSNTIAVQVDAAEAIFFTLINQKLAYNWKHQPLFIKVDKWAMLQLHKGYSILATVGITKKLT